jgi:hypothetical protein
MEPETIVNPAMRHEVRGTYMNPWRKVKLLF